MTAKVTEVPIFIRDESAKGPPVPRGFVSVALTGDVPQMPKDGSGRQQLAA